MNSQEFINQAEQLAKLLLLTPQTVKVPNLTKFQFSISAITMESKLQRFNLANLDTSTEASV